MTESTRDAEFLELQNRLEEAEETLRAIRDGEVDALVVDGPDGERIFTLQGADHSYRAIIEAMQQGAVSLTGDGTVLFCNRCFSDMVKKPQEKVIGASIFSVVPTSQRATFESIFSQGLQGRSQGELQFRATDGTLLPVFVVLSPLSLPDAEAICMVVTDLTEQKQHRDLQDSDRRKTEFLATLGHELRNPLAPIRTGLEVMKLAHGDLVIIEEVRSMMERQVRQMVRLIDDLLDVSRITQGKMVLRASRVDLAEIIQSAVEATRSFIDEANHELTVSLPHQSIFLNADPTRLAQVFSNLLNNSAKYTPKGGRISLSCQRHDSDVVVSVRDNGLGIPANMLDDIFKMFTQIDRAVEEGYTGLGVGLTLVKRLIEMHGGIIEVRSDGAGQGSEFIVRLPILSEVAVTKTVQEPRIVTRSLRILVADDNKAAAIMLSMVVKMLGNDVRTAHDGDQAINVASEFLPEVVLMDLGMPKMNGYEAARHIRQQAWGKDVLLVALTGWGQDEDKERTRQAGFDHHLIKPAEPATIEKLLASANLSRSDGK